MSALGDLLKKYPNEIKLVVATPRVSGKTKHPRDLVIQNIRNTLAYLKDPKFVVKRGTKTATPDLCYLELGDGTFEVYAKYARGKLKLDGNDTALSVTKERLEMALNAIIDDLKVKLYDTQLEEMRKSFKGRLKGKPGPKAKK